MPQRDVVDIEVVSDRLIGRDGGFLALRRLVLRNRYADGARSEEYLCDLVQRDKGLDAVAVTLWHRGPDGAPRVLLREGLRPPLLLGRPPALIPCPDPRRYLRLAEVVAGIVEVEDRGDEGIRRRAAAECLEEAGFVVAPAAIVFLGAPVFLSPGVIPERLYLAAAEVDPAAGALPLGDGSPMEDGPRLAFRPLDEAIAACLRGEIEHAATELSLRRLRERLAA